MKSFFPRIKTWRHFYYRTGHGRNSQTSGAHMDQRNAYRPTELIVIWDRIYGTSLEPRIKELKSTSVPVSPTSPSNFQLRTQSRSVTKWTFLFHHRDYSLAVHTFTGDLTPSHFSVSDRWNWPTQYGTCKSLFNASIFSSKFFTRPTILSDMMDPFFIFYLIQGSLIIRLG